MYVRLRNREILLSKAEYLGSGVVYSLILYYQSLILCYKGRDFIAGEIYSHLVLIVSYLNKPEL